MKKPTIKQLIQEAINNSVPYLTDTNLKEWHVQEKGNNIPIEKSSCNNAFSKLANIAVRLLILERELPKDEKMAKKLLYTYDSYIPTTSESSDQQAICIYFKLLDKASDKEELYKTRLTHELKSELSVESQFYGGKFQVYLPTQEKHLNFDEKWMVDQWLVMYKDVLRNPPKCRPTTFTNSAIEAAIWVFDRNYYWELTL